MNHSSHRMFPEVHLRGALQQRTDLQYMNICSSLVPGGDGTENCFADKAQSTHTGRKVDARDQKQSYVYTRKYTDKVLNLHKIWNLKIGTNIWGTGAVTQLDLLCDSVKSPKLHNKTNRLKEG